MAYIIQRQDRFYVVVYDGVDPLTRKERRRWHPVGCDRAEAEACAARLHREPAFPRPARGGPITVGSFLTDTWMPQKRRHVRATTAYRYAWFIERYLKPAIGDVPLRRLRADHLDSLYESLAVTGGRDGNGLAPKTILEVHIIVRAALDVAVERELAVRNVAHGARARRRPPARGAARAWNARELATFLSEARRHRLYAALHLAAHTGMRRGELVGLKWSDLDRSTSRVSISRTLQNVGGRPVEFGVKTCTSRRTVDLDTRTARELAQWHRRLRRDRLPCGPDDWMFCNSAGRFLNPQSVSQLFDRLVVRTELTHIRFHDLRHTHATLLNAGVPQHVIQKLLGHASPRMTARCAQIHDHTVRDAFERYCAQRVNTAGEHLDYDPDALTADAEWVKHNLARIRDSLPNGYCGRPPQQNCPHPNACLTCPDFQTTPEFLDIHRRQADSNRRLIARAEANGQFRLVENLQQVQTSLERIIPALEAIQDGGR